MMGFWGWGGYGGWVGILGTVAMWLVIGGIIWLVWALGSRAGAHTTVTEALQLRYARGEITKEQYDKLRSELR